MNHRCPVYQTMDFIGKRWTVIILLEIYRGKNNWKRYSRIKENIHGITPKMLSMRLKELGKEEMIRKRVDDSTYPVKSEYSLTPRGEDFINIVKSVKEWGLRWKVKNKVCEDMNCKDCDF